MKNKKYTYYVSYLYKDGAGSAYLQYGEPLDTNETINRAHKDIEKITGYNDIVIMFFKRIKSQQEVGDRNDRYQ